MKFNYNMFSYTLCLLCIESLCSQQANALSRNCSAGEYAYLGTRCKSCPDNCYCPTNGKKTGTGWTGISCNINDGIRSNTGAKINDGDFDIHMCPANYPFSLSGATSASDCYAKSDNTNVYNKTVKCNPGQYLPSSSNSCTSCKSDSRYYCPGGSFHTSLSSDVGLKTCPSGQRSNSSKTSCESSSVKCSAGQYLPKNATSCQTCKSRYYLCVGGTFSKKPSSDQGIRKCDGNMIANAGHTACINENTTPVLEETPSSTTIHVESGFYLPANKNVAAACSGAKKYCPGGDYDIRPVDQGIFDCPFNGRTNATKSACTITLTKDQMKFGPLGSSTTYSRQCWHKTSNADEFKSCVFGIRHGNDSE